MNVLQAIKERRSIREFQRKEIPPQALEALSEALIWAPSAGNLQSRRFYFVFNQEVKERLARAALNQDFIAQAPLAIVACADHDRVAWRYRERGVRLYCLLDVAASIQNLLLAAHELGLATVWVGAFREEEVSRILGLPPHLRPITIVPVGYPAEHPAPPRRVSKEEAIVFVR
ncbi:MAG: nitroreductase family protein [Anaerolineae bacterium]